MTSEATLDLLDEEGEPHGRLAIRTLPGAEEWQGRPALEISAEDDEQGSGAPVRLLEEVAYRYRLELLPGIDVLAIEPQEALSPDGESWLEGRLQPGRMTGTMRLTVVAADGLQASCEVEVRSRKLDYESEYRRMMQRIAEEGAELIQSSFAGGRFTGFEPDRAADSRTLYQRFAFVASLLESEPFAEAIEVIRYRPHTEHRVQEEQIDPARSLKPSRSLARQLVAPAERQAIAHPIAGLTTLPRTVTTHSHVETLDTVPNRFVRFALEHWKMLAARVHDTLPENGVEADRGRREAKNIEARLERLLAIPALAESGPLTRFPSTNTVLNSRVGYREIFRSFLLSDAAASLSWEGGDEVFSAGKRDVATLYEYWVFLELARVISRIPGFEIDKHELVAETKEGLNLELRRGRQVVLSGEGMRRGRRVSLELWFNRSFVRGDGPTSSWTVAMRPDCSLRITPHGGSWDSQTWVHFDAKYRIEHYSSFFDTDDEDEPTRIAGAKGDDLRKMHAYRDAIRKTAGAYVLYPGEDADQRNPHRQYHEVLPGLGAFVLRPSENGEATSVASAHLGRFITDVIDHAAAQGTSRERVRYWEQQSYGRDSRERRFDFEPALTEPPADSTVLLGYVRSAEHLAWIEEHELYNLRADPDRAGSVTLDSPSVRADFVALYSPEGGAVHVFRTTGGLFVRSGGELRSLGYPTGAGSHGSGDLYLCVALGDRSAVDLDADVVRGLAPQDRSPLAVSWEQLAQEALGDDAL